MVDQYNFEAMSVDKLWNIYQNIRGILTNKLSEQKRDLDSRLHALSQNEVIPAAETQAAAGQSSARETNRKDIVRRPYPKVLPIYRNPSDPSATWSGRGKRPRWLVAKIDAGKDISEFLIKPVTAHGAPKGKAASKRKTRETS